MKLKVSAFEYSELHNEVCREVTIIENDEVLLNATLDDDDSLNVDLELALKMSDESLYDD